MKVIMVILLLLKPWFTNGFDYLNKEGRRWKMMNASEGHPQFAKKRRVVDDTNRCVLLLHDNTPVHKALVAMVAFHQCGFTELNHTPYSSDLAQSEFFLFSNLEKELRRRCFKHDSWLEDAVEKHFKVKPKKKIFLEA